MRKPRRTAFAVRGARRQCSLQLTAPGRLRMHAIGTPCSDTATRVMLFGAGELGREIAIELQRLGCEVIAVDRYANAPAMAVAHRSQVRQQRLEARAVHVLHLER